MVGAGFLWDFVTGPAALGVLVLTLVAAWPLGRLIARRRNCSPAAAALLVVAVGLIAALTLTPGEPPTSYQPPHFLLLLDRPAALRAQLTIAPADAEQLANVALYVPVGFFGRHVWHSATRAAVSGFALTAFAETCQYAIAWRAGSLTDIRNNTAGAILGALLAALAVRVVTRAARRTGSAARE